MGHPHFVIGSEVEGWATSRFVLFARMPTSQNRDMGHPGTLGQNWPPAWFYVWATRQLREGWGTRTFVILRTEKGGPPAL